MFSSPEIYGNYFPENSKGIFWQWSKSEYKKSTKSLQKICDIFNQCTRNKMWKEGYFKNSYKTQ